MVNLTTADVQDTTGAEEIVCAVRRHWPWVKPLFADDAYNRAGWEPGRLQGRHPGRRARAAGSEEFPGATAALSGGALFQLDDALAQAGARL